MRILLVSNHADPLARIGSKEAGGQNIYVFYLTRFLCKLGMQVDVYTRWDKKNKKEVIKYNSHLRIIRVKAGPKRQVPRDDLVGVLDEFAENVLKRIRKEKLEYDIIHTNYWLSGLIGLRIAEKIRKPLVHVYHSIGQIRFESLKAFKLQKSDNDFFRKRKAAEQLIADKAAGIISTSPIEKEIIRDLFKIEEGKIKVITIGVDTRIFHPVNRKRARRAIGIPNNAEAVLYIGRIEWRKGIGTLLYAFKEIAGKRSNARLYIVGGGKGNAAKNLENNESERLKGIVSELGLDGKVEFLGAKQQNELHSYYSACDVCVVPSYYEPFGIVPVEAMACGTPVVASRTGGLQYTVKEAVTGYLAKPRDFRDLARKIARVLERGKESFSFNCIERVEKEFIWDGIAGNYVEYLNQIISGQAS